jgi:hypothetical protein
VALACEPKQIAGGGTIRKCCNPGHTWNDVLNRCLRAQNGSDCTDDTDCVRATDGAQACKKNPASATQGKCCLPGDVLNPSGNCSAGTDGDACTTSANCKTGTHQCATNDGSGKCCPIGFEWDSTMSPARCVNTTSRPQGARCFVTTGNSTGGCAPGSACDGNMCRAPCPGGSDMFSAPCGVTCVTGALETCCDKNVQCVTGTSCSIPTGTSSGLCCPSGTAPAGHGVNKCVTATGRSIGTTCTRDTQCSSGFCGGVSWWGGGEDAPPGQGGITAAGTCVAFEDRSGGE